MWSGHYEQDGQNYPMKFDYLCISSDAAIKGHGRDNVGEFHISTGRIIGTSTLEFEKRYFTHYIFYKGHIKYIGDSIMINGYWGFKCGEFDGAFQLTKK